MRNLKRALSMAMASVMLMGMSVVGTSAASVSDFSDVDSINNLEAVSIATGLGIFDGYDDGEFKPEKVVTRAEMAVVIAKILHGADVDPATFVGESKFTDVPDWAEGYVNLVSSLGIIKGYGDGKFGPNDPVTTVQANIMLLKALGYYTSEGDNLPGNWADAQLAATSKATALGFFGEKSLGMSQGLTREDVAELTFNALFAQRVAYDDVRGLHVKANNRNVVVTNGTKDEMNTLAQNTFGLYAVEGLVVENGTTNINLEGKTKVVFDEAKDVTGDGKVEDDYSFELESGLDMIGHATTVYYKVVKKAPVVYAAVDQATKVEVTTVGENLSTTAKKAGFDRDTSDTVIALNYNLDNTMNAAAAYATYEDDAVILVSNSADLTVDFAIVVDQELDFVKKVSVNTADKDDPIYTYTLQDLGAKTDNSNVVVIGDVEKNDYVITTKIADRDANGTGDLLVIQAAETEVETITEVTRSYTTTTKLASEAVDYKESPVAVRPEVLAAGSIDDKYEVTPYAAVLSKGEYVLIYDDLFGKLIGVAPVEADNTVNYAYVAQFGHKINTDPTLNDKYALTAHIFFADGTNGVYTVETGNKTGNAFYGKVKNDEKWWANGAGAGVVIDQAAGNMNAVNPYDTTKGVEGAYVGLYNVTIQDNGKALIKALTTEETTDTNFTTLKKGVTYMGANGGVGYYGSSKTVGFFVDGKYDEDADDYGLSVGVVTGMANMPTVVKAASPDGTITALGALTPADLNDDAAIVEGYYTAKTGYNAVDTFLAAGYEMHTAIDGIYFYNGDYKTVKNADGKWDLEIYLYDNATGKPASITYSGYTSDAAARAAVSSETIGFYTDSGKKDDPLKAYANTAATVTTKNDAEYGVYGTFEQFAYYGDILTLYTTINTDIRGVIATETPVIDLTKNNITSLEALDDLIEARQEVYTNAGVALPAMSTAIVSYSYDKDDNTADFIYITDVIDAYSKDYTGVINTAQNVAGLTDTLVGSALTINYVDGKEIPSEAAAAYLATLGYTLTEYDSISAPKFVKATRNGVTSTFSLTEKAWFEITVDGKLVAYNNAATAATIDTATNNTATGYIKSVNGAAYAYAAKNAAETYQADAHVAIKTGYYSVNVATSDVSGSTNSVLAMTPANVQYVHKDGSLVVTVVTTANSAATKGAKLTLTGTGVTTANIDLTLAEVKAGMTVTFTVKGIAANVADLKVAATDAV